MTATQNAIGDDRFHRAALRARESQRDAILYACEQLRAAGIEPTGPEARQWLERHGRTVGRTTVWKVVSEYLEANGQPDPDGRNKPAAGGADTERDGSEHTEQPSPGGPTVSTPEPTEADPDPTPADADDSSPRTSGEQPQDSGEQPSEPRPAPNSVDRTSEPRHLGVVNAVPEPSERSLMADSAPMGTIGHSPESGGIPAAAVPRARPRRALPTWPVLIMAFPAFVAIWSGWVGLGQLTGFGMVHPLPGIADSFTINSAITLPIGVEAYASYALYVWLSGRIETPSTRTYAMISAFASLAVGAAGQIAYHLMEARHITSAPWWIITMVACLPVAVVGMGAVLAHLIVHERHLHD
ncbi:hypothetical protein [Nocardia sp. alder85J]|uniref:hypothetical protein n=1 Tax=Nocardia sp. alder85J TaxID=2862949 RepID=UPI001CD43A37|nr:hypothetical protein [Nocardia sp. alder85J]MCX4099107.1 hypothetical protein [Nocardia sp. alder85J]